MPQEIRKVHRLLDLVALLTSRHYPLTRSQLWDEVEGYRVDLESGVEEESVRRKFERDKKELLELGFPLETIEDPLGEAGEQQRYRLSHRDFYLPYLRLVGEDAEGEPLHRPKRSTVPPAPVAPEDAWVVAEALHLLRSNPTLPRAAAAESAFRKLTFDLEDPGAEFGTAATILSSDDDDARARVDRLNDAVRTRRRARFDYHSMYRDANESRRVEPWALLFKYNRWYLIAFDLDREARRTFRVSRMSALEIEAGDDAFPAPELDLSEWTTAEAWSLPGDESEETAVDVLFRFPRSLWADRNDRGELVETREGGASLRRFRVRSVDPFLRWLLTFGREVEVVSPSGVTDALAALRARVAELHGGQGGAA